MTILNGSVTNVCQCLRVSQKKKTTIQCEEPTIKILENTNKLITLLEGSKQPLFSEIVKKK